MISVQCVQVKTEYTVRRFVLKKENRKKIYIAAGLLAAFVLWTAALCFVDVQPVGPEGSYVGFATINRYFHRLTGVHMGLYTITDWLGLVPVAFMFGFATLGLVQWIKRRRFLAVDRSLLVLGGFYLVVMAAYVLFETVVVNYRPVLIAGFLEVSYPSSTTLLVMCVMPTARRQLRDRIKSIVFRRVVEVVITGFAVFMVIGRLLSGVHWLTDIAGGALLSGSLVFAYDAACAKQAG